MFIRLLTLLICYILGVVSGIEPTVEALAVVLLVCLVAVLAVKKNTALVLFVAGFFVLGMFRSYYTTERSITPLYQFENKYVTLVGRVSELPDYDDTNRYILTLDSATYMNKSVRENVKIKLTTDEVLAYGQTVSAEGFLKPVSDGVNSSDYDFARHYKTQGVFYTVHALEMSEAEVDIKLPVIHHLANSVKWRIYELIHKYYTGDTAAVLASILTGIKNGFSDDYTKIIIRCGANRFYVPTFIQLMILTAVVGLLVKRLDRKYRTLILAAALILYGAANSNNPVVIKATALSVVIILFEKFRGFSDLPTCLTATALGLLIVNPLLCYNGGFICSVVMSTVIYYFMPYLRNFFISRALDEKLPSVFLNHWFVSFVCSWILGLVGLLPIGAYIYGGVAVYTILFSITLLPIILICGVVSGVLIVIFEIFGSVPQILNYLNAFLINAVYEIPILVDKLPFSYIRLPRLTPSFVAALYIFLGLLYYRLNGDENVFKKRVWSCVAVGLLTSSLVGYISENRGLSIYFVNVGQGDAAILHTSGGETVLIDGGGADEYIDYNFGEEVFLPYITDCGIYNIDVAVVSHYHTDHYQGILAAVENLNVHTLVLPDYTTESENRKLLEAAADNAGTKVYYAAAGDVIKFRSGLELDVISPDAEFATENDENDSSLVMHVKYGEFDALFTGDISEKTENAILTRLGEFEVVKVPHHGSDTSSSAVFTAATSPEIAVICVGEDNPYGHPSEDVVGRYINQGTRVLRTDTMGDVCITTNKDAEIGVKIMKGIDSGR